MHPFQQPYGQGMNTRAPGPALSAMLAGRTLHGMNPMDQQRQQSHMQPQEQASNGLAQLLMQQMRMRSQ